jgi:type I restriction-modification system DNA methylase subunit
MKADFISHISEELGYTKSPSFVHGDSIKKPEGNFAHLYERANEKCGLRGVYTCQSQNSTNTIPVVYICQANSEKESHDIHKKVWNQNIVPFLLVISPDYIRLYNGFDFDPKHRDPLEVIPWTEVQAKLQSISRTDIDNGLIWDSDLWKNGPANQSKRLDVQLLKNLNALGNKLVDFEKIELDVAHGLIGKYIYLRYLRDRQFLSDKRLQDWGIKPEDVFTKCAKLQSFEKLNEILQDKLNGSIFPLPKENERRKKVFDEQHLQYVAGTFFGNDPKTGQQSLFDCYDFAFIPTELLSIIYEQFLHRNDAGKDKGAYYTPLPLVNFVLNELEEKKPFVKGMRVLDPSCGSGAFLVQTYRHLIRTTLQKNGKERLTPKELKNLLTEHIFGIDIDRDACRVAQLGLLLTLLDNLELPHLFGSDQFHLPKLDNNIVEADTFDESNEILQQFQEEKFDWIIGNPPWKELGKKSLAAKWIKVNTKECPVSNSIAEAFLWRSLDFAPKDAAIGLLMPAMSLFNKKDKKGNFRQHFFTKCDVWTVANFANLRNHLFAGAVAPCATFFFRPERTELSDSSILTYCPLRVNQTISRSGDKLSGTWNVIINASEIQFVRIEDAITGDTLVWKTAMWGSHRDMNLLQKVSRRFDSFENFAKNCNIIACAGATPKGKSQTNTENVHELSEKKLVVLKKLKARGRIFVFPCDVLKAIDKKDCFLRKKDGKECLKINYPPHIFLDKARRVAIYSDDYFIVPSCELGIAGNEPEILKALALYFCSDFFRYQQFFLSTEWGIRADIATLEALKQLPVPLKAKTDDNIKDWANIYDQLQNNARSKNFSKDWQNELLLEANKRINKILKLRDSEQLLISDFIKYKMKFIDGRIAKDLIAPCDKNHLNKFAKQLQIELDSFFEEEDGIRHEVIALNTNNRQIAGIRIDIIDTRKKTDKSKTYVTNVSVPKNILDLMTTQHSQWLYFQRNLLIYDKQSIFIFKPNEKMHWLESRALVDADNIIIDILTKKGDDPQ